MKFRYLLSRNGDASFSFQTDISAVSNVVQIIAVMLFSGLGFIVKWSNISKWKGEIGHFEILDVKDDICFHGNIFLDSMNLISEKY